MDKQSEKTNLKMIRDIMTKDVQIVSPETLYCRDTDEAEAVAQNMAENKVRRLPVLDKDKRLVGIVSLGDLAVKSRDHIVCGRAFVSHMRHFGTDDGSGKQRKLY